MEIEKQMNNNRKNKYMDKSKWLFTYKTMTWISWDLKYVSSKHKRMARDAWSWHGDKNTTLE